jgi:hypothetical protein
MSTTHVSDGTFVPGMFITCDTQKRKHRKLYSARYIIIDHTYIIHQALWSVKCQNEENNKNDQKVLDIVSII